MHLLVPHLVQEKIGSWARSVPGQRRDGDVGDTGGTEGPCQAPTAACCPVLRPAEQKSPLWLSSGEKCRRKLPFPTKSRSQTVRNEAHGEILPAVYFTLL